MNKCLLFNFFSMYSNSNVEVLWNLKHVPNLYQYCDCIWFLVLLHYVRIPTLVFLVEKIKWKRKMSWDHDWTFPSQPWFFQLISYWTTNFLGTKKAPANFVLWVQADLTKFPSCGFRDWQVEIFQLYAINIWSTTTIYFL